MRKKICILFVVICLCSFGTSCNNGEVEVQDVIIDREYTDWEITNSVIASTDHQLVQSLTGQGIGHNFEISLSADWKKIVTGTLKYELELDEAKFSGTSTYIDKGQTIDFYCRIVYDIHLIQKINKKNPKKNEVKKIKIPRGPEYGWKIYDENNNLIEDTVSQYSEGFEPGPEEPGVKEPDIEETDIIESCILDSRDHELGVDMLRELSDEELYYIRNGIYAYQGRIFNTSGLNEYYSKYDWYFPCYSEEEFRAEFFNKSQARTISNIVFVENERKN